MGLDAQQFMSYAINPVLDKMTVTLKLPMNTIEAKQLLVGTFFSESHLKYLHQINGPALGLCQVEPATYIDVCNYVRRKGSGFFEKVLYCIYGDHYRDFPSEDYLQTDLRLQVAIVRLIYWRVAQSIPETLSKQAEYYKTYFNTPLGKATVSHYLHAFPRELNYQAG
tara:strand:+ start:1612 stop:2112 length:501 start_codon:yes stop_codon:yes gene_type:complete